MSSPWAKLNIATASKRQIFIEINLDLSNLACKHQALEKPHATQKIPA
jgi:hypothetical protein